MTNDQADANQLVTATSFARNFPALSSPMVERDHLIDTLAQVPSADTPVVFLEGAEGGGATTLLAQFAIKHSLNSFALFVKPASRLAYSPDYLRLMLAEQIWFYLHGTRLEHEFVDIGQYQSLLFQVRKRIRSSVMYILVDGINHIAKDDSRLAEIFSDVLNIGWDGFRFIITGRQDDLSSHLKSAVKSKTYQLLKFSDYESRQLLLEFELSEEEREQLLKICNGNPGRLCAVRRLLISNISAYTILQSDPNLYLEFLSLEFGPIAGLTETQRLLLAVLAFSRHTLSTDELIDITPSSNGDDLLAIQRSCTFVILDNAAGCVEFRSEAHRKYAEKSLKEYRLHATNLQIEALILRPESSAAIRFLPTYYQSLNQQQAIVDLMSKEHYSKLLEHTQSISALKARAAIGARSAFELKKATEVLQFALHRSIFSAVADLDELQSEVSALVALGQSHRALDIAAQCATKEMRLYLLAEYARRIKEQGGTLDAQIVIYIQELASGIDFAELNDTTIRLSENLLFVDPDLALLIVDNALKSEGSAAKKDAAFAHLSIAASQNFPRDENMEERPRSRIGDERLQGIVASLTSIVAEFSFAEIERLAMEIEIGRRIYFLRNLVAANTKRANVLDVVDFALDQLVANTSYTPKAHDLADLAIPLAKSGQDMIRVRQLVKRLEGQIGLVEKGAPSADLIRLQMYLSHAEIGYDVDLARSRISEAYYSVVGMENIEIRVLCLAAMSYALPRLDCDGILENSDGFRAVILADLKKDVDALLGSTASHFQVVSPVLKSISSQDPAAAFELVGKINTENRRDRALGEIARYIVADPWSEEKAVQLQTTITRIVDQDLQNECIHAVVRALSASKYASEWAREASRTMKRVRDEMTSCEVAVQVARIGSTLNSKQLIKDASEHFDANIRVVDSLPFKLDIMFQMSAACASLDADLANRYYDDARTMKSAGELNGNAATEIIFSCLWLLIRAFRGLLKTNQLPDDYLERFSALCERISCSVTRAMLYNELACRAWCEGRTELCVTIVDRWCHSLLGRSSDDYNVHLIEKLFPAIYCAYRAYAFTLLSRLSVATRSHVLVRVAKMVLRKKSPNEPSEDVEDERIKVVHEQLLDIVILLEKSPTDWSFYEILSQTTKAITQDANRPRISRQQRADFANGVSALIPSKLPDAANIQHQGYVVVSKARILSVQLDPKIDDWNSLIADARTILNVTDRAYVLQDIVQCMPKKLLAEQRSLAKHAYNDVCAIPSSADRYGRLESYIRTIRKIAPVEAHVALKQALLLTFEQTQRESAAAHQRRLVDLAEAMGFNMVDQLAEIIDDDPARAEAKLDIKKTVEMVKLRKTLAASSDSKNETDELSTEHLSMASWKNLSALICGRLETKAPGHLMKYVNAAGSLSLSEAYPVLSWFIENCTQRFSTPQDVGQQILPLCEVILLSTEIAASIISQAPSTKKGGLEATLSPSMNAALVIKPGERESALEYIRQWFRSAPSGLITYCDPYFDQLDVELLRIILAERPDSQTRILTSMDSVLSAGRQFTYDSFMQEWSELIDQDPPETEVIAIAEQGTRKILIHDRWLIIGDSGLVFGTSFKSLGSEKLSSISPVNGEECNALVRQLDQYFSRRRVVNGIRVMYSSINL